MTTEVTDARLAEILTARWSDGEHAHGSEIESCLLELQRLRASSTASEKDAARYRWLRDKADPADCDIYLASDSAFVSFRAAAVDASIDAAMEKANG